MKSIRYLALALALAASARADKQPRRDFSPDEASSLRHFERAKGLFRGRDYYGAIAEFELAHDARPSPVILYNLGACYEQLFKYAKALEYYDRYLVAASAVERVPPAKRTPQQRDEVADLEEVRRRMAQIKGVTGFVSLRTKEPGATVAIDGDDVGRTPVTVRLGAGAHRAEVAAPGKMTQSFSFTVEAVVTLDRFVDLEPLPTSHGTPKWAFYGAAVVTGAATLAATAYGAAYLRARSDYQGDTEGRTPENADRARTHGKTANVLLGVAGVLGASTTVLYFTTDWRAQADPHMGAGRTASFGLAGAF